MLLRLLALFAVFFLCVTGPVRAAVILQYHHISDETPPSTSTSPKLFAHHLAYLKKHDYRVLPLPELLQDLREGVKHNDKVVAITFDDGYDSIYTTAYPLLKRHGFAFTVFINTEAVGGNGLMPWEKINDMTDHGATIANHTRSHAHLVRVRDGETREQWRQRIRGEILEAEREISSHTGHSHKLLAYPYGEFNRPVTELVKDLGFTALGQHSGAVGPGSDWLRLPRFPMGGNFGAMDKFATKVDTLALPLTGKLLQTSEGEALSDAVVAAGSRPRLLLTLESEAIAAGLQCFFQGDVIAVEARGKQVAVQPNKPLTPGRQRYNCTARHADTGRYFWYSQPWLVTSKDGQWVHEN